MTTQHRNTQAPAARAAALKAGGMVTGFAARSFGVNLKVVDKDTGQESYRLVQVPAGVHTVEAEVAAHEYYQANTQAVPNQGGAEAAAMLAETARQLAAANDEIQRLTVSHGEALADLNAKLADAREAHAALQQAVEMDPEGSAAIINQLRGEKIALEGQLAALKPPAK